MLHIDTTAVSLQNFYPENLIITSIDQEGTTQSEVARQVKKPGAITCIEHTILCDFSCKTVSLECD